MKTEWVLICFNPWTRSEVNITTGEIRTVKFGHFQDSDGAWHRVEYFDGKEEAKVIKLEKENGTKETS